MLTSSFSSQYLSKNLKIKMNKMDAVWLWNMAAYFEERTQVKSIWKQDPKVNISIQEGREWGMEKVS